MEWSQSEGAEFQEGAKRATHQVFYRFLVLVYFSQRLVVSLHFVNILSQVLHTVTEATEGKQHLDRDGIITSSLGYLTVNTVL